MASYPLFMMLLIRKNSMENKKMISFEASKELKEALRIAAFRNSMSISAYIREVLQKEVSNIEARRCTNGRSEE